jgi:hypothetical protein
VGGKERRKPREVQSEDDTYESGQESGTEEEASDGSSEGGECTETTATGGGSDTTMSSEEGDSFSEIPDDAFSFCISNRRTAEENRMAAKLFEELNLPNPSRLPSNSKQAQGLNFCPLCAAELLSDHSCRAHYLGAKHAKILTDQAHRIAKERNSAERMHRFSDFAAGLCAVIDDSHAKAEAIQSTNDAIMNGFERAQDSLSSARSNEAKRRRTGYLLYGTARGAKTSRETERKMAEAERDRQKIVEATQRAEERNARKALLGKKRGHKPPPPSPDKDELKRELMRLKRQIAAGRPKRTDEAKAKALKKKVEAKGLKGPMLSNFCQTLQKSHRGLASCEKAGKKDNGKSPITTESGGSGGDAGGHGGKRKKGKTADDEIRRSLETELEGEGDQAGGQAAATGSYVANHLGANPLVTMGRQMPPPPPTVANNVSRQVSFPPPPPGQYGHFAGGVHAPIYPRGGQDAYWMQPPPPVPFGGAARPAGRGLYDPYNTLTQQDASHPNPTGRPYQTNRHAGESGGSERRE